jgi:hypothetical protein
MTELNKASFSGQPELSALPKSQLIVEVPKM